MTRNTIPAQAVNTERIRELLDQLSTDQLYIREPLAELTGLVAKLLARPVPDVTRFGGKITRAVIPTGDGWLVAVEDDREWATFPVARQDGTFHRGQGHYFHSPDQQQNKRDALRDLARRAGLTPVRVAEVGLLKAGARNERNRDWVLSVMPNGTMIILINDYDGSSTTFKVTGDRRLAAEYIPD